MRNWPAASVSRTVPEALRARSDMREPYVLPYGVRRCQPSVRNAATGNRSHMSERPSTSRRAVDTLRRLAALVPVVLRTVRRLALLSACVVVAVVGVSVAVSPPADVTEWVSRTAIAVAALVPAGVLLVFAAGIENLRALPSRFRDLPADVGTRLSDVRREGGGEGRGRIRSLVSLVVIAFEAREYLSPFAVVSAGLRPALLFATLLAVFVAVLEIPVALVILLILAT